MKKDFGYTLIELLVGVSILAVFAIVSILQFRTFGEDKILASAAQDIQSFIRVAQTNAQTGVLCYGAGGAFWSVHFQPDTVTLDHKCAYGQPPTEFILQKNLKLPLNIQVDSIVSPLCQSAYPQVSGDLALSYAPITGKLTFETQEECIRDGLSLTVSLKNTKTNKQKAVMIDKGGAVDVK